MDRRWKCVLAGGPHHGASLTKLTEASLAFPPALTIDGQSYHPMTMTSTTRAEAMPSGCCVMAHGSATLEQVNDAHERLLQS